MSVTPDNNNIAGTATVPTQQNPTGGVTVAQPEVQTYFGPARPADDDSFARLTAPAITPAAEPARSSKGPLPKRVPLAMCANAVFSCLVVPFFVLVFQFVKNVRRAKAHGMAAGKYVAIMAVGCVSLGTVVVIGATYSSGQQSAPSSSPATVQTTAPAVNVVPPVSQPSAVAPVTTAPAVVAPVTVKLSDLSQTDFQLRASQCAQLKPAGISFDGKPNDSVFTAVDDWINNFAGAQENKDPAALACISMDLSSGSFFAQHQSFASNVNITNLNGLVTQPVASPPLTAGMASNGGDVTITDGTNPAERATLSLILVKGIWMAVNVSKD